VDEGYAEGEIPKLAECQGHCPNDLFCAGGLKCVATAPWLPELPGCEGFRSDGFSYCVFPVEPSMPKLSHLSNASVSEEPLGLCQGSCMTSADCYGDLICFQRDGSSSVPGCDGEDTDERINYCGLQSQEENVVALVADWKFQSHHVLYPLGKCLGGCSENFDCAGGLVCSKVKDNEPIPGCIGIGGSGVCYNPGDDTIDGETYQEIAPVIKKERYMEVSDLLQNSHRLYSSYSSGAVVQSLTFFISNFPDSIQGIQVLFNNGEISFIGRSEFPNLDISGNYWAAVSSKSFEFGGSERLSDFTVCSTQDDNIGHVSIRTSDGKEFEVGTTCLDSSISKSFDVDGRFLTGFVANMAGPYVKSISPMTRRLKFCDSSETWVEFDDQCFFSDGTTKDYAACQEYCDEQGAVLPCVDDSEMNSFLSSHFHHSRSWIGMAEGSLDRWSEKSCLSDYRNWHQSSLNNDKSVKRCTALEGGNRNVAVTFGPGDVSNEIVDGGGSWTEIACDDDEVQCICQKPHPSKITPRGSCIRNEASCFPMDQNDLCRSDPSDSSCWDSIWEDHPEQLSFEYSLAIEQQTIVAHEDIAREWGGNTASVHSNSENDLFIGLEFGQSLYTTSATQMTQDQCYTYCGLQNAEPPCVENQEMDDFILSLTPPVWLGYDGRTNEGRFTWRNRQCISTYSNLEISRSESSAGTCAATGFDLVWNLYNCDERLTCLCQSNFNPCLSGTLSDDRLSTVNTSNFLLGAQFGEETQSFEWLDETEWDFENWAAGAPPIQNATDGFGVGLFEIGAWSSTPTMETGCAPYKRQKQFLEAILVDESNATTTFNMVPGTPLIDVGLKSAYVHHQKRASGSHLVEGNGKTLRIRGRHTATFSLRALIPTIQNGFKIATNFEFQSDDENSLCFSKLCVFGVCENLSTAAKHIAIEPNMRFGKNRFLIVEQYCEDDAANAQSTISNIVFKTVFSNIPTILSPSTGLSLPTVGRFPLEQCRGGCESNEDCVGYLECFQDNTGRIPGCPGASLSAWNYCYDPFAMQDEVIYDVYIPFSEFECNETNRFELYINTDNYGGDTSWEIRLFESFDLVAFGSGFESNQYYEFRGCLPDGEYEFIFFDAFGDGICCNQDFGSFAFYSGNSPVAFDPFGGFFQDFHTFKVSSTKERIINGQLCEEPIVIGSWCDQEYSSEGEICDESPTLSYCSFDIGPNACAYCPPPDGCSFDLYPVCPGLPSRAFCDGSIADCATSLCDCPSGKSLCENFTNPCLS